MKSPSFPKASALIALFSVAVALFASAFLYPRFASETDGEGASLGASASPTPTVIIDAGHGGVDGGCVSLPISAVSTANDGSEETLSHISQSASTDTVLEKDCNLAISKTLAALFRASGYNVVMTRETDVMLDAEGLTGNAKMRDLKARLEVAKRYPTAIFISIHCNKFPSAECKGLQVYYSVNDTRSREIADMIQTSATRLLQPENKRATKPASSSIYVLYRASQPSVLVECGFLSNPEEAALLANGDYRKQLALAIFLPLA